MISSNQRHHHDPHKPSSILVVDDDFDTVAAIKLGLQEYGFNVYTFTDPQLALEHYRANVTNYSLVISDFKMQVMNGVEFMAKIKKIKPECKIFLMTSFDIDSLKFQSILSPSAKVIIDEFIQKPISTEKLIVIIKKHINRTRNSQETL
jgi:DNA-binding NtrC family response regulator